jgi:flavin reductase (DIM6/NTAB) family NADH-FMN oxidoreductase RutF
MHISSSPAILYFGTPVVLISTLNHDRSANLAPISSVFWLGWRCVIGIGAGSKTAQNMTRTGECVLNLPSVNQVDAVNRLALTTGCNPVSAKKQARGYRHVHDKFGVAGLTSDVSETVIAPRVRECPVQMETVVEASHGIAENDALLSGGIVTFELRVLRVHLDPGILMDGEADRVDPDKWRPLIMSFQKFYGLDGQPLSESSLSSIPEAMYRSPDIERARNEVKIAV